MKRKSNNVWMYTITLPNPDGNSISTLHTYCVAVGAGSLDHTVVIDWYANEMENLMKGDDEKIGSYFLNRSISVSSSKNTSRCKQNFTYFFPILLSGNKSPSLSSIISAVAYHSALFLVF